MTTLERVYNCSHKIMTLMFQIAHITRYVPYLLHDSYSERRRGLSIDRVLNCTLQVPERVANNSLWHDYTD